MSYRELAKYSALVCCLATSLLVMLLSDREQGEAAVKTIRQERQRAAGVMKPESSRAVGGQTALGIDAFDCSDCLHGPTAFAYGSENQEISLSSAGLLGHRETREGVILLVKTIMDAHLSGDGDLKDRLLQFLAGARSPESVAGLLAIITGKIPDLDFDQLPEDVRHAIQKSIRLNSDDEETGLALLAACDREAYPGTEVMARLEDIQHPLMTSILAAEAHERGDVSRSAQLAGQLASMSDPHALESMMLLSTNDVIPLDEAIALGHSWAASQGERFDQDYYAAFLSDSRANNIQRVMAAYALAASSDVQGALAALEKACDHESDYVMRSYLQSAMHLVTKAPNQ